MEPSHKPQPYSSFRESNMARVVLSLVALFLSATYVAGQVAPGAADAPVAAATEGDLAALCKKTHDVDSCIRLLAPAITQTTRFDSLEWYRKVLSKSLSKAIVAKNFMTKKVKGLDARQQIALMFCVDKISDSVELLQQVSHEYLQLYKSKETQGFIFGWHKKNVRTLMETATSEQKACFESLEGRLDNPMLVQARDFAGRAYIANKVVKEIVLNV